jgi:multiple sugar transport system permease protein
VSQQSTVATLKRSVSGYLFLLPALVLFALFAWWPIINGLLLSFQNLDLIRYTDPSYRPDWIGLENFRNIMNDPLLGTAWLNTLRFMLLGLALGYLVPVILAVSVNEIRRGKGYFRLAFYLPVILPPMISILLWKYFYDPGSGIMNVLVTFFGGDPLQWIYSADTAMISLVILWTWTTAGSTMLLYLAALQGIPASLYESAEIEGATVWQRLWHITLPEIRGVMIILLVLQIIGTMQIFTEPFVMTDGGPVNSTLTVMVLLYRYAFERGEIGWATALGLLIFVVLVAFSLLYLFVTRRFRGGTR